MSYDFPKTAGYFLFGTFFERTHSFEVSYDFQKTVGHFPFGTVYISVRGVLRFKKTVGHFPFGTFFEWTSPFEVCVG